MDPEPAEHPIIFDASAMRSLLAGGKTEARVLAGSPLRDCRPGDRLWVKEGCAGAVLARDGVQMYKAAIRRASFVVFADGWRQYRDGRGESGPAPTNPALRWVPAILMPRWASRATLVVEAVRIARLREITPDEVVAEGRVTRFAGLYWRWDKPVRGVWRDPRRAFAALWDGHHGTGGERWEDDPQVVVLSFRLLT
jgi:hypothetical protein